MCTKRYILAIIRIISVGLEAYLKCIGTGLMEGLDYVEVQNVQAIIL